MDISGFKDIKVSNALIVFLLITICAIFPCLFLFILKPEIIVSANLLNYVVLAIMFGCANYGLFYTLHVLNLFYSGPRGEGVGFDESEKIKGLLLLPLIESMGYAIFSYGALLFIYMWITPNFLMYKFSATVMDCIPALRFMHKIILMCYNDVKNKFTNNQS